MAANVTHLCEGQTLASDYIKYRPSYPPFILETILKYMGRQTTTESAEKRSGTMIDVGCGSGQATHMFAIYFENILGIDISVDQIDVANKFNENKNICFQLVHDNIFPIDDGSCDLVNCATAVHWLDLETFDSECHRVLKPGGAVAAYTYLLLDIKPLRKIEGDFQAEFFRAVVTFINDCQGHEKSKLKGYQEIFEEIKNPSKQWVEFPNVDEEYTLPGFKHFMGTLGEYPTYMLGNPKADPMDKLGDSIKKLLGDENTKDENVKFIITFGYQLILFKN